MARRGSGGGRRPRRGQRKAKQEPVRPQEAASPAGDRDKSPWPAGPLTEREQAQLGALGELLTIEVNGDWETQSVDTAFTCLDGLMEQILAREGGTAA